MTTKIRWNEHIQRYLSPSLRRNPRVPGKGQVSFLLEFLEDRTTPAYVPLLGTGQLAGAPSITDPGHITGIIRSQPNVTVDFPLKDYESIDATTANGFTLRGFNAAAIYNTEGPIITINGGYFILGSNILLGRASGFGGTIQPGNEILVNGGGSFGLNEPSNTANLKVTVDAGSQVLMQGGFTTFDGNMTIAGSGPTGAGVIQALSGYQVVSGNLDETGIVTVGAEAGGTLIINGPVNGIRSNTAFANFTVKGAGTVILDNVAPSATVTNQTPAATDSNTIVFRVELSEDTNRDLVESDLSLNYGFVSSVTKISSRIFDFTVEANVAPGDSRVVTASLGPNLVYDHAFLSNTASNPSSILVNHRSPFAYGTFQTINQAQAFSQIQILKVFVGDGSGIGIDPATINASNLLVTTSSGQTLTVLPNPSYDPTTGTVNYAVFTPTNWGTLGSTGPVSVNVSLVANQIKNLAGTANDSQFLGSFTVDTIAPTLTYDGYTSLPPTNGSETVNLKTGKPIASFDPAKFTAIGATITSITQTGPDRLSLVITPDPGVVQRQIVLKAATGALVDFSGNQSQAVTADPAFLYDTLAPKAFLKNLVKVINAGNSGKKQRIDFSIIDPLYLQQFGSGIDPNTITINNITVTNPKGNQVTLSNFTIDTQGNASVEIDPAQFPSGTWKDTDQGSYSINLNGIQDRVGNPMGEVHLGSFEVGTIAPTPTLAASPVDSIDGISQVTITFDTSPGVEITNLELAQILVNGPASLSNLQKIGTNQFTVDVSPTDPNATVSLSIEGGSVHDRLGNASTPSNILNLNFSLTKPVPTIVFDQPSTTNSTHFSGRVIFSEPVDLVQLSLSDLNFSSGAIDTGSFLSDPTFDSITFPFSFDVPAGDQNLELSVNAGILPKGTPNVASSKTQLKIVQTAPTVFSTNTIDPVNTFTPSSMGVIFRVQFAAALGIGFDLSNAASALKVTLGTTSLDYQLLNADPSQGIAEYLIKPAMNTFWTDSKYQGHFNIELLPNKIFDLAGNSVAGGITSGFDVSTRTLGSSVFSNDVDANLQWINPLNLATTPTPGTITVQVQPTLPNGSTLPASELNLDIVPDASYFRVKGFAIQSVSSKWQDPAGNPYLVLTLVPETDTRGVPTSVGPASVEIKANAFFDIYGNPNSPVPTTGNLTNGNGFLSFLGIDRAAPVYSTTGFTKNVLVGSFRSDAINIRITYEDGISGINAATLGAQNILLTRGTDHLTNYAVVTATLDPSLPNTVNYTLTPISQFWGIGDYDIRFTGQASSAVRDQAQSKILDATSANGLLDQSVNSLGTPVSLHVQSLIPSIDAISPDTGVSTTDQITNTPHPTFLGAGEKGTTVFLYCVEKDWEITTQVDASGKWQTDFSSIGTFADGIYHFTAWASDTLGNTSLKSQPFQVEIDTTPYSTPTIDGITPDTGRSSSDGVTNDPKLTIFGTADAGAMVVISEATTGHSATVTADATGKWAFPLTGSALLDGIYQFSAKTVDIAGNESSPTSPFEVRLDTQAPTAPAISSINPDSGTPGDQVTNQNALTLNGTTEPLAEIEITQIGTGVLGTAIADDTGNWSFNLAPFSLADGTYQFTAVATDIAGNLNRAATSAKFTVVIDSQAPGNPVINGLVNDPGNDGIINNPKPSFTGSGEPNASVSLFLKDGKLVGTGTVNSLGTWQCDWGISTPALPDGDYQFYAVQTDKAGNSSGSSALFSVHIDTVAPNAPTIDSIDPDSGSSGTDHITSSTKPTFHGTAEPGSTLSLKLLETGWIVQASVLADGSWTADFKSFGNLPEGTSNFAAQATDIAGNQSSPSSAFQVVVDTQAPSAPKINSVSSDTGRSNSDGVTKTSAIVLNGTSEAGSIVEIRDQSSTLLGMTQAGTDGSWSYSVQGGLAQADGAYSFTATAIDTAGNTSVPSATFLVVIDTQAPNPTSIDGVTPDTGIPLDGITAGPGLVFSGISEANAKIDIHFLDSNGLVDPTIRGTALSGQDGKWFIDLGSLNLAEGKYQLIALATDVAGNTSPQGPTFNQILDKTAPLSPNITALAGDSGASSTDGVTNLGKVTLSGTAEPNSQIQILETGMGLVAQTFADASGNWVTSVANGSSLGDGTYFFKARATDAAGNTSTDSKTFSVVIDTAAPANATIDAVVDDTGLPGDGITAGPAFILQGTAEANTAINILSGTGSLVGSTTAGTDGRWTFDLASQNLSDGTYSFTAVSTDLAGNSSNPSASFTLVIDRVAPYAPVIVGIVGDTNNDGLVATGKPAIYGTSEANAQINLFIHGVGAIGQTTADANGKWLLNWPTGLLGLNDGTYQVTSTASDAAGNLSQSSSALAITVDTLAPNSPLIVGIAPDTGSSSTDGITSATEPVFNGTAEPDSVVTLTQVEKGWQVQVVALADGTWSANFSSFGTFGDGTWHFQATSTDPAGNTSPLSKVFQVVVDTNAPSVPTFAGLVSDTGRSNTDGITKTSRIQITGTAEAGSLVTLSEVTLGLIGQIQADLNGNWTIGIGTVTGTLVDGTYHFSANATDTAGNQSSDSNLFDVVVDTKAPKSPVIGSVTPDSGIPGDGITNTTQPVIRGTAEPNSLVQLQIAGLGTVGSVIANDAGSWSIDLSKQNLTDGSFTITAVAVDVAGNTSLVSTSFTLVLDRTPPLPPTIQGILQDANGDRILSATRPTLTGMAEPNSTVQIQLDTLGTIGETAADASGKWSFLWPSSQPDLTDGTHTLTAQAVDLASNQSNSSAAFVFVVDTTAPDAPVIKQISPTIGNSSGTPITDSATPTILGTAEPGARIQVTLLEKGWSFIVTAGNSGIWSGSFSAFGSIPNGPITLTSTATDVAGNQSIASNPIRAIVDVPPPLGPGFAQATLLSFSDLKLNSSGSSTVADQRDFFRFVAPQTGFIDLNVQPDLTSKVRLILAAYDSNQQAVSVQAPGEQGPRALVRFPVTAGKTYYLLVESYNDPLGTGGVGTWSIQGQLTPDSNAPMAQTGSGTPIILDGSGQFQARGTVDYTGDGDLLTIHPVVSGNYLIRMSPTDPSAALIPRIIIVGEGLQEISEQVGTAGQPNLLSVHLEGGRSWYLRFAGDQGTVGDFVATVQADDFGTREIEAGGFTDNSGQLHGTGAIQLAGDTDLFRLDPTFTGLLQVVVKGTDGSIGGFGFVEQTVSSASSLFGASSLMPAPKPVGRIQVTQGSPLLLRIEGLNGATGNYVVTLKQVEDDYTDLLDPTQAAPITVGTSVPGKIESFADKDVFVWTAPTNPAALPPFGAYFALVRSTSSQTFEPTVRIYEVDSFGSNVLVAENTDGFQGTDAIGQFSAKPGVTYLFEVSGKSILSLGSYQLLLGEDRIDPTDDFGDSFVVAQQDPSYHLDEAPNQTITGIINPKADTDIFQFVPNQTGKWIFRVDATSGASLDPFLTLYNSSQVKLISNDNSGPGTAAVILADLVAGQRYFLAVSGSSGTGQYKLSAAPFKPDIPLPADDSPAGTVQAIIAPTTTPTTANGAIDFFGDTDTFSLGWPAGAKAETLLIKLSPQEGSDLDPYLEILDANGNILDSRDNIGTNPTSTILFDIQPGQTIYLRASGSHGTTGKYTLSLQIVPLNQPDPFTGNNANNLPLITLNLGDGNLSSAVPVYSGTASGRIDQSGDKTFLRIKAPIDGLLTLTAGGKAGSLLDPYVSAFTKDPNADAGILLGADDHSAGGLDARLQIRVQTGQEIIILVRGAGGTTGGFDLKASLRIDDHGDTPSSGTNLVQIGNQATGSGTIETGNDTDLFLYRADRTGSITASLTAFSSNLDPYLFVYRSTDGALISSDNDISGTNTNSQVTLQVEAGKAYYFAARSAHGTLGQYTLEIKPIFNPFPTTAADAQLLPLGPGGSLSLSGTLNAIGESNWFKVVPQQDGFLKFHAKGQNNPALDPVLGFFNDSGQLLAQSDDIVTNGIKSTDSEISIAVVAGRTYLVQVSGYGESTGSYGLVVGNGTHGLDSVGDTTDTAEYLKLDSSSKAHVDGNLGVSDTDYYHLLATADADVVVKYSGNKGEIRAFVRDSDGSTQVASGNLGTNGTLRFSVRTGQEVFLAAVAPSDGLTEGGNFTLDIQLKEPHAQAGNQISQDVIDALNRTLAQSYSDDIVSGMSDADYQKVRDEITKSLIETFKAAYGGQLPTSYLITWIDPSDFVLTDSKSQHIGNTASQSQILENPNASLSQKGALDLLIIPGAQASVYNLNLFGLGGERVLAGATLVKADGSFIKPNVTLNGNELPNGLPVGPLTKDGLNLFLDFRGFLSTNANGSDVIAPTSAEISVAAQQIVNTLLSGTFANPGNLAQKSAIETDLDLVELSTLFVGVGFGSELTDQTDANYNSNSMAPSEGQQLLSLLKGIGIGIQTSVSKGLRLITDRGSMPTGGIISLVQTTLDRLGLNDAKSLVNGVGENAKKVFVDTVGQNLKTELVNKPLRQILNGIYRELDRNKPNRSNTGSPRSQFKPAFQEKTFVGRQADGISEEGESDALPPMALDLDAIEKGIWGITVEVARMEPGRFESFGSKRADELWFEAQDAPVEPGSVRMDHWTEMEEKKPSDRFWGMAGAALLLPLFVKPIIGGKERGKGISLEEERE